MPSEKRMNAVSPASIRGSMVIGLLLATASFAQSPTVPANAPVGATGLCKDGTYWTHAGKVGACKGHNGIQTWYGSTEYNAADPGAAPAAQPGAPQPMQAAPQALPPPAKPPATDPMSHKTADAGMVWVDTRSRVYYCPSDHWYGKTKEGAYMSEADAKGSGVRPNHGKACG